MRISDWSSDVCSSDLDFGIVSTDPEVEHLLNFIFVHRLRRNSHHLIEAGKALLSVQGFDVPSKPSDIIMRGIFALVIADQESLDVEGGRCPKVVLPTPRFKPCAYCFFLPPPNVAAFFFGWGFGERCVAAAVTFPSGPPLAVGIVFIANVLSSPVLSTKPNA